MSVFENGIWKPRLNIRPPETSFSPVSARPRNEATEPIPNV
ncbi:hypothetical protein FRUB_02456 [Fimbriiglobus ruber]|uniref:Uncharacterized protein n=1 Tax=Fimbriiglobus ruber TaxID=1908690 RepID=A0A225DY74_9BACT|nr:hypothetical protein FRUB_02456 [Fimbriiglobus ruber]